MVSFHCVHYWSEILHSTIKADISKLNGTICIFYMIGKPNAEAVSERPHLFIAR